MRGHTHKINVMFKNSQSNKLQTTNIHFSKKIKIKNKKQSLATYICNPSTWEAKAERSGITAIPQQENESRNNGEFYRKSHPSAIE